VSVVLVYFKNNETPSCVCLFLYIVLIFSMRELYILKIMGHLIVSIDFGCN
jgi:uncharacterized protein YybS (DUF2232 family)